VTKAIIEGSPRLKLIGRAGTGTDNIDADAATRHGILVMKFVHLYSLVVVGLN
jgi:D-3-phosphoglycerate dehydrogenase / 2-oxoglutarate reductase